MEINGEIPKEIQYINKLLLKYPPENGSGLLKRGLNKIRRRKKGYSRSELSAFLNKHGKKDDDYAHQFLKKLIEEDILVEAGKRKTASNQITIWKLDKKKLLDAFTETRHFQENRELYGKALDRTGEVFKFS